MFNEKYNDKLLKKKNQGKNSTKPKILSASLVMLLQFFALFCVMFLLFLHFLYLTDLGICQ